MPVVTTAANWTVGIAEQPSGESTIPTVAEFEFPVFSGTPTPTQTIDRVLVTDNASVVGQPYKLSGEHWEADISLPAYSLTMGRLLQGLWPVDTITGSPSTVAVSAATATATIGSFTTAAHAIVAGDVVTVAGVTPSGYNGTWNVLTAVDNTHFTAQLATTPTNLTVAGTVLRASYTHTYSSLGTIASTSWQTMYSTPYSGSSITNPMTFEAGLCSGITFSFAETGGPVTVGYRMVGKKPTQTTHTITTSETLSVGSTGGVGGYFTATAGTLQYSANSATPVTATNIQSGTINVDRAITPVPTADGVSLANLALGLVDPSFTMTLLQTSWAEYLATYFGSTTGTVPSSTIVTGSVKHTFVHSVQSQTTLAITIPSAVLVADQPQPNPQPGTPATVTINGYAVKPPTGDHVQPILINSRSTSYT